MMWIVAALFGIALSLVGHAALRRLATGLNAVIGFFIVGGIVCVCLTSWLIGEYGVTSPKAWAGALIFCFGCELYVFLFTLAMASVSASLLVRLMGQDLTDDDVHRLYDSQQMVAARIDRLVANGFLIANAKGLQLTVNGSRVVRIYNHLHTFFHHPMSDSPLAK